MSGKQGKANKKSKPSSSTKKAASKDIGKSYKEDSIASKKDDVANTQEMFESGTFSARYMTNRASFTNQDVGSLIKRSSTSNSNKMTQSIKSLSSSSSEKEVETYDVNSCKPITIQGGFQNSPVKQSGGDPLASTGNQTAAQNKVGTSFQWNGDNKRERRQSILSNMISSTYSNKTNGFGSLSELRNESVSPTAPSQKDEKPQGSTASNEINVDNPTPEVVQVVQKHLVVPHENDNSSTSKGSGKSKTEVHQPVSPAGADFSSLKLQGGDITRGIYNWVNEHNDGGSGSGELGKNNGSPLRRSNSDSGHLISTSSSKLRKTSDANGDLGDLEDNIDDIMTPSDLKLPGGFRRSFLAQKHLDKNLDELKNQQKNHQGRIRGKDLKSKTVPSKKKTFNPPNFFTRNFIEFLTLYGHFAGEDLEEDDNEEDGTEDLESLHSGRRRLHRKHRRASSRGNLKLSISRDMGADRVLKGDSDIESFNTSATHTEDSESEYDEDMVIDDESNLHPTVSPSMALSDRRGRLSNIGLSGSPGTIQPNLHYSTLAGSARMRQKKSKSSKGHYNSGNNHKAKPATGSKPETATIKNKKVSNQKALLLLLKAFIGTGIVFLPKAFSNGGLLFCNVLIVVFSILSYYCFIILIKATAKASVTSYGDVGFKVYGKYMKGLILISLILSQLGFASSYVVFVAQNLLELVNSIFHCEYGIELFIFIQLIIFLPLSLTRNIGKLSFTALIADFFIALGLLYIYACSSVHLVSSGVSDKISMFKPDTWTLFIGTVVFAYEGVGLLIPIQESMEHPEQFSKLLALVIGIVTVIFVSLSTICYLSYGDDVQTVILMNFPRNAATLFIQLFYSLAILLSTPLQLFPAIKIVENYLFSIERKPWQEKIRRESESLSQRPLLNDNSFLDNNSFLNHNLPEFNNITSYNSVNTDELSVVTAEGTISGKSDPNIKWMKNILRVLIVLSMCIIGYYGSNDLDRFVSLIGSFTCVPLIYIYPPLLYLKSYETKKSQVNGSSHVTASSSYMFDEYDMYYEQEEEKLSLLARVINWTIFVVGVGLMSYTSFQTISSWSH